VSRVRNYELTFIIAPDVEDQDVQAVVEKVSGWIEADGGEVTSVDLWGRRRLAYPIRDYSEGTYVLLNVQLETTVLNELGRNLKLDMSIIRYLLVRVEE
jgi:small subunit ribosomal protein S6